MFQGTPSQWTKYLFLTLIIGISDVTPSTEMSEQLQETVSDNLTLKQST